MAVGGNHLTGSLDAPSRALPPTANRQPPTSIYIALGSNLGDRAWHLRRAMHELRRAVHIVRVSSIVETDAVDAPAGSPPFLNVVLSGYTSLPPHVLMEELLAIERRLGRAPRRVKNEPRIIDLDMIAYGATRMRTRALTLPHPRAQEREFVMKPLREISACRAPHPFPSPRVHDARPRRG